MSLFRLVVALWVLLVPAAAQAVVTYDGSSGVYTNIFSGNSQQACTACHNSSLADGAPRNFAPLSVNFNTYAWAISSDNEVRAAAREVISSGHPCPNCRAAPCGHDSHCAPLKVPRPQRGNLQRAPAGFSPGGRRSVGAGCASQAVSVVGGPRAGFCS